MPSPKRLLLALLLSIASIAPACLTQAATAPSSSVAELNRDSTQALKRLVRTNETAADLSRRARAVLIFPNIVKAGFIFGGAYGEGELRSGGTLDGYYNSLTASWGLQAGGQAYGYIVFLMSQKAVDYVHNTHGWEIGVGPTVVVLNEGAAKNLSSSTLKDDAYAFIFDQKGIMASLSIEGTKITRIHNP